MKKFTLALSLFFYMTSVSAQKLYTDTVFPYKIIGASEKTVLSGNTEKPFIFTSSAIGTVLKKAIENRDKVLITYDPASLSINKVRTIRITDIQAFVSKHHQLRLGAFRFNRLESFTANESNLLKALRSAEPPLEKVIPAQMVDSIFRYFLSLSCANTNRCNASEPCITYDYKVDGCYARAHMMRKILAEKYHFDCQKIFVEGRLRAINTGNCGKACVPWGWHVAIYVQSIDTTGHQAGLVIDPSLSDKPCTMEEWAAKQGMSCCPTCRPGVPETPFLKPSYVVFPNGGSDDNYKITYKTLYDYCRICH